MKLGGSCKDLGDGALLGRLVVEGSRLVDRAAATQLQRVHAFEVGQRARIDALVALVANARPNPREFSSSTWEAASGICCILAEVQSCPRATR